MPVVYDSIMNLKTGSEEKLIKEKWNFLKSAVSTLSFFPEIQNLLMPCEY